MESKAFWQAKIWGLLHDSPLKSLQKSKDGYGPWDSLRVMKGWQKSNHIGKADTVASSSDRAAIGAMDGWSNVNYDNGLKLRHLLSGKESHFELPSSSHLHEWRNLSNSEEKKSIKQLVRDTIPETIRESEDPKEVFWYLWRYLPEALSRHPDINNPSLLLTPAETRIPDCSIWSHNSMTAALSGCLAGYDGADNSRPHIVTFTFTPVQEMVKHSRKMQDFWAGSWLLHYLSASICWAWAEEFGPDSLVYPSLYAQPLIDRWLLAKYPNFESLHDQEVIQAPKIRQLLTAGFPNVLVIIVPEVKVKAAIDKARRVLTGEDPQVRSPWMEIAKQVKQNVFGNEIIDPRTWESWLSSQWQTYWTAIPLGDKSQELSNPKEEKFEEWKKKQNELATLPDKNCLFTIEEGSFFNRLWKVNVGSWWAPLFDRVRLNLTAVKNARNWSLPTAFGMRSTISGIGPVVCGVIKDSWATDKEIEDFWSDQRGLFDGRERLNASEVVKRGLERVLRNELEIEPQAEIPTYPDLTVGVAGWLKCSDRPEQTHQDYQEICENILEEFNWARELSDKPWGIPWIDDRSFGFNHPRLLNSGWLIEDFNPDSSVPLTKEKKQEAIEAEKTRLNKALDGHFPHNNPTDWYVLVAGDGDDMGEWLKGTKMKSYREYVPSGFPRQQPPELEAKSLNDFLNQTKRMGPATHAALSRALLDFSNQLVPYLTEERYAGRLIYGGGDDVLAYTNLWEWDRWLWDIRQCFKGQPDPSQQFDHSGDYWRWKDINEIPDNLSARPLFTMGSNATISFGIIIAHHSVPLAIALESMWEAEEEAKEHKYWSGCNLKTHKNVYDQKDAVQVRVIYGNGNMLRATCKFDTFRQWQALLSLPKLEPALFEQAATVWEQHPVPIYEAIDAWCIAFCDRREKLTDNKDDFQAALANFFKDLWTTTEAKDRDREIQNWLKLAAFTLRKREIKIPNVGVES